MLVYSLPHNFEGRARQVLARAEALDLPSLNEANTKALLIEPMLAALGWDVNDLAAVTREYRVYDSTFLDYALLVAAKAVLFCEAKPTGKKLTDARWVAQTVNYANNEGVVWCLLTDGLRWRVFKANEAVPMEQKLAFEVDVRDLNDPDRVEHVLRLFAFLTPAAVAEGELSALGTQVFVDGRVRAALMEILVQPSKKLVDALRAETGTDISPAVIKAALSRITPAAVEALLAHVPVTAVAAAQHKRETTQSQARVGATDQPAASQSGLPDSPRESQSLSATPETDTSATRVTAWADLPDLAKGEPATRHQLADIAQMRAIRPEHARRQLLALIRAGVLTPGQRVYLNHKGVEHSAILLDSGEVRCGDDEPGQNISAAAAAITGHAMNGWVTWFVKQPDGTTTTLAQLRGKLGSNDL